jgi:glutamate--cysteine ligase catalytic subunit
LSTSCPIWKGYLSDVDSRWNILSQTSDDRTKEEIEKNISNSSRYSSVNSYLSNKSEIFNDIQFNYDQDVYQTLIKHGFCLQNKNDLFCHFLCFSDCPSTLAKHFANLFTRDPLYVTDKQVYPDDDDSTTIFAFEVVLYLKNKI